MTSGVLFVAFGAFPAGVLFVGFGHDSILDFLKYYINFNKNVGVYFYEK
jgi:hypothetical protein